MKPQFTEREIEELSDLNFDTGYQIAVGEVINHLKSIGFSDVSKVINEIRREFLNNRIPKRNFNRSENYKNSTLTDKLFIRIDYENER
jgi:hypothetical protein